MCDTQHKGWQRATSPGGGEKTVRHDSEEEGGKRDHSIKARESRSKHQKNQPSFNKAKVKDGYTNRRSREAVWRCDFGKDQ